MRKIYFVMTKIYIKLLYLFTSIFTKNANTGMMHGICKAMSNKTSYVAFQIKPWASADIPLVDGFNTSHSFAIVLQGPICTKNDMTLNTILFYKKVYPYAVIIISTWEDEKVEQFEKIKDIVIIRNKKPLHNGIDNVNLQLVSSLTGIKKAKELGCIFSVKTRTDQRICKPYIFDLMISALGVFPSNHNCQKGRLITLGMQRGGMFMPWFVSDFMYLGYTDDLIKLLSVKLDYRKEVKNPREITAFMTRRQNAEQMIAPEVYIFKHYCKDVLKCQCADSIESFWESIKKYFICFGMNDVDLMWEKYDWLYNLNNNTGAYYGKKDSLDCIDTINLDFFNWFNLYSGNIIYDKKYEKYADVATSAR